MRVCVSNTHWGVCLPGRPDARGGLADSGKCHPEGGTPVSPSGVWGATAVAPGVPQRQKPTDRPTLV